MAALRSPRKSLPAFRIIGGTLTIIVEGATATTGWSVTLKSDLMGSGDAGWACTGVSASTSGGNVTITATIPSSAPPELLDLIVSHATVGTFTGVQAVAIKATLTPASVLLWWRTDMHGRYETPQPNITGDTNRNQSWWRTWQLVQAQNSPLSLLNPWAILNSGDLAYALNSDGSVADGSSTFARFAQETRALTVPEILIPGNHDRGRTSTSGANYDSAWAAALGPRYGVAELCSNLRVVAHDYSDTVSKTASETALGTSYAGATILLEHKDDEWDRVNIATYNDFLLALVGHLHRTELIQASPRVQMLYAAHKFGVGWPITLTRASNNYGFGSSFTGLTDNSVKEKLLGDYGAQRLSAAYSQPNNGTARSQTVSISNALPIGNSDGRVRLVMESATYTVSGGTLLASYALSGGKTVLICQVSIPAASGSTPGTATLTATATTAPPDPGDDPPPDTTTRAVGRIWFYGLPAQDAAGVSLSPNRETALLSETDLFVIRSRTDMTGSSSGSWTAFKNAGYTGPALLYQRPPTEVQTSGTLLGSQLWDNSAALQSLYDAMIGNDDCYLYSDVAATVKITAISNTGFAFDPAHPSVRAFAKAAALKYMLAYTDIDGIFWDNIGLYENANDDTGVVRSRYLGLTYSSSTMDAQEQALFAEIRSHVTSGLGARDWLQAGNLLAASQERDWRTWSMDGIMDEGIVGFTQSSNNDSAARVQAVVTRAREFLNQSSRNFVMVVNQTANATPTDAVIHQYGLGVALAIHKEGVNSFDVPYVTYRHTRSDQYGRARLSDVTYSPIGAPSAEPVMGVNLITRRYTTGLITIDLTARTYSYEVLPPDEGSSGGSGGTGNQFVATVVGVRADLPTGRINDGSTLAIDGSPRAVILVKVTVAAGLAAPSLVTLSMPVAVGATVTPHAQLVESFDPATVTWNTRPRALTQSYPTGVTVLVSNSTVALVITEVAKRKSGNDIYLALLMDAETEPALYPSGTLVWSV